MRRNPTASERRLWELLRRRQAGGFKFRRQHVIAGYIVDFYCPELQLIIEVDGPIHEQRVADDEARDADLTRLGNRVVRIEASSVMDCGLAVLDRITRECERRATEPRELWIPL